MAKTDLLLFLYRNALDGCEGAYKDIDKSEEGADDTTQLAT